MKCPQCSEKEMLLASQYMNELWQFTCDVCGFDWEEGDYPFIDDE